jgi:hypothetical protein
MQSESYESTRRLGPGERIDPDTGTVLYSAAWLSDLRVIPDPPPRVYKVRVALGSPHERDDADDDEATLSFTIAGEIRVAASGESHGERAARRLLAR